MQEDGNLVLYHLDNGWNEPMFKPIWASQTYHSGEQPHLLVIEKNGELVIYDSHLVPLWKAETAGKGIAPRRLVVTDDGDLHLIDFADTVLWRSGRN